MVQTAGPAGHPQAGNQSNASGFKQRHTFSPQCKYTLAEATAVCGPKHTVPIQKQLAISESSLSTESDGTGSMPMKGEGVPVLVTQGLLHGPAVHHTYCLKRLQRPACPRFAPGCQSQGTVPSESLPDHQAHQLHLRRKVTHDDQLRGSAVQQACCAVPCRLDA